MHVPEEHGELRTRHKVFSRTETERGSENVNFTHACMLNVNKYKDACFNMNVASRLPTAASSVGKKKGGGDEQS